MEERPVTLETRDTPSPNDPETEDMSLATAADEEVSGRYGAPWDEDSLPGGTGETPMQPDPEPEPEIPESMGIVGHLQSVAEPVASVAGPIVDHIVGPVAGAIGSVLGVAGQAWGVTDALIERRVKRMAKEPLANLYEVYPEARLASPRELGLRFVPVEEIRGTAVAGMAQRGGDFLPLKAFRGENWEARWRRIKSAVDRLQPLPPVDLIKYDGDFWVVDGHNRVAVTLYTNGVGLDAMVTELVPLDGRSSERPAHLLSYLGEAGEMRAAAAGHAPAIGLRHTEQQSGDEASSVVSYEDEPSVASSADEDYDSLPDEEGYWPE